MKAAALLLLLGCLAPGLRADGAPAAGVPPYLTHGVALQGYDAVAYVDENRALPGYASYTAKVDGVQYQFASAAHRDAFTKKPARYEPAYGGWCAYAMARGEQVEVNPRRFKIVGGRLLLFYDGLWGDTLAKWNTDEAHLLPQADAWWKKLNP